MVYLGGLGDQPRLEAHLRSRAQTAEIRTTARPPAHLFPGGHGGGSAQRVLPDAPLPGPAAASDDRAFVALDADPADRGGRRDRLSEEGARRPESTGREIQIGGPDVLSYGDMLDGMAHALKTNPRPRVPVPLLTPGSSLWIGLVTPVDAGVARPLIEGLSTPTTVTDPSGAEPFGIEPVSFAEALRRALAEDSEVKISG